MHNQAQFPSELDVFSPCRQNFEQTLAWLRSDQVPFSHADTERQIWGKGVELMRLLYQAHLDHGSAQESRPVTEPGYPFTGGRTAVARGFPYSHSQEAPMQRHPCASG